METVKAITPGDRQQLSHGPWLVGTAACLWGLETYWRVSLNRNFPSDVMVFIEHGYCVLFTLPVLWVYRGALRGITRSTWLYLLASSVLGSALGTLFFTLALRGSNASTVNVLLQIQPIFGVFFARLLLKEPLHRGFFLWGLLAIVAGIIISLEMASLGSFKFSPGLWMILGTTLCWGFSTVAGRKVNLGMDYHVATPLRFLIGFAATGSLVILSGHATYTAFSGPIFFTASTQRDFLSLSLIAGVAPLFLYFKGLGLTKVSVATFLEMLQIVAALVVTWGLMHEPLAPHQVFGAVFLIITVWQINRVQGAPDVIPESVIIEEHPVM